jgi:hypothetical protein
MIPFDCAAKARIDIERIFRWYGRNNSVGVLIDQIEGVIIGIVAEHEDYVRRECADKEYLFGDGPL